MKKAARLLGAAGIALSVGLLGSCYPFIGSLPAGAVDGPTIQHVPYSGTFDYTVNTGATPHDVYFVFTNPDRAVDLSTAPSIVSGSITVNGRSLPALGSQALASYASAPQTINDWISEWNRNPRAYLPQASGPSASVAGPSAQTVSPAGGDKAPPSPSTGSFWIADPAGTSTLVSVNATCQLVVGPITFGDGRKRTLSIWVDDAVWNVDVTLTKVQDLAAKFLQDPETQSDIYHWDTAVVGEPWGPQSDPNLIAWDANNTVTILLTRLNSASAYSGGAVTVGYFWAKDNFSAAAEPGSNQRIMFYIDSKLYGTTFANYPPYNETGWAVTNYWPKIVFSTLAHEFQHMIQFYQKQVLQGTNQGTDTWINEMCSMIMEDLVADKQGVEGPRGVSPPTDGSAGGAGITGGRIPTFNQYSYSALVRPTTFDLTGYSVAYAFGAWLARNYGGTELLRRIVQCPQTDESAVVNAVIQYTGNKNESLATLLERWAAAVLLSDTTSAPSGYRYNVGTWFTSSAGGQTFDLGSMNFFNYSPSLTVFTPGTAPTTDSHSSNLYYLAATGLTGSQSWKITVPAGLAMNVVIR